MKTLNFEFNINGTVKETKTIELDPSCSEEEINEIVEPIWKEWALNKLSGGFRVLTDKQYEKFYE